MAAVVAIADERVAATTAEGAVTPATATTVIGWRKDNGRRLKMDDAGNFLLWNQ